MRAFEVYLNGRKICTAGLDEAGVVTSSITWVCGVHKIQNEQMSITISGLKSQSNTFIDWSSRRIKKGDEIKILVIDSDKVSKPNKLKVESLEDRQKAKLSYLKRLAKELGYSVKKSLP